MPRNLIQDGRWAYLHRQHCSLGFADCEVCQIIEELIRLQAIEAAVDRSEEFDIAPCLSCGKDCICLAGDQTVCSQRCADEVGT